MNIFEKIEVLKEEYLFFKHLFLDFSDYTNIKISFPIGLVTVFLCIALCVMVFLVSYKEATNAKIATQLLRHDAKSEDTAVSLKKLRLTEKRYKKALSGTGKLTKMVARVGYTRPTYEEYVSAKENEKKDFFPPITDDDKIYIAQEAMESAELLANTDRSTVVKPIILSAVILVVFSLLFIFMPDILNAVNSWIG